MSAHDSGEAEYPFDKVTVFNALLRAIPRVEGMSVHLSDPLSGRIVVKASMSLFSWGENIPITLTESAPGGTRVSIASAPKTGISTGGFLDEDGFFASGDLTFGKNRRNVDKILAELSAELARVQPKPADSEKRKCPFCAETIQREAIKCRYCGSDLSGSPVPAPSFIPPPTQRKAMVAPEAELQPLPLNAKRVGAEIHFQCSLCDQALAVDASGAGQELRCPECGEHLVVPSV